MDERERDISFEGLNTVEIAGAAVLLLQHFDAALVEIARLAGPAHATQFKQHLIQLTKQAVTENASISQEAKIVGTVLHWLAESPEA